MLRAPAGRPTVIAEVDVTSAIKETDTFVSTMVIEVEFWGFRLNLASWTACRTVLVRRESTHGFCGHVQLGTSGRLQCNVPPVSVKMVLVVIKCEYHS
jgi:hypothetical protein